MTCSNGGYFVSGLVELQPFATATRPDRAARSLGGDLKALMIDRVPLIWPSVYSGVCGGIGCPGCQCPRFGAVPRPLALVTKRSLPSATMPDGYQPTGILPVSLSLPPALETPAVAAERSNNPTALLSPSATNSRVPSGESASAFGVLPSPVAGPASSSVATICRLRVSTTTILSVLPDATKSRVPSPLSTNADGWRPTRIRVPSPSLPSVATGNADTVHPSHAET